MAAEEAVALENITCEFPGVRALDSVTLGFAAGQVHAVAGENGAGKSTLLKVLAGLVVPVSGRVRVHGRTYPGVRRVGSWASARSPRNRFSHLISPLPRTCTSDAFRDGRRDASIGTARWKTRGDCSRESGCGTSSRGNACEG